MKRILGIILIMTFLTLCGCGSQEEPGSSPAAEPTVSPAAEPSVSATAAPSKESPPARTPSAEPSAEAAETDDPGTTYPLTVTDLSGKEITIESAGRIVSLSPSNTEIVVEEGGEDRLVGVDSLSGEIAPDARVAGEYEMPDAGSILALSPDVVFAGDSLPREVADELSAAGVPVVISEATSFDQIEESFRLIGRVIDEAEAAEQLCAQLSSTIEDVQAAAPAVPLSAYFVMSFAEGGNWTSGEGGFVNAMIEYAGGIPVTNGEAEAWLEYPLEDLAAADPDCIIVSSDAGDYSALAQTPGYMDLRAVRDGLVFLADADVVTRPGPSVTEGLLALSGIIQAASQGPAPTAGLETAVAPE